MERKAMPKDEMGHPPSSADAPPPLTSGEIEELEGKFGWIIILAEMQLAQCREQRAKAGHHDIAFTKADGSKHGGLWQSEWDNFVAVRDEIPRLLSSLKRTPPSTAGWLPISTASEGKKDE